MSASESSSLRGLMKNVLMRKKSPNCSLKKVCSMFARDEGGTHSSCGLLCIGLVMRAYRDAIVDETKRADDCDHHCEKTHSAWIRRRVQTYPEEDLI